MKTTINITVPLLAILLCGCCQLMTKLGVIKSERYVTQYVLPKDNHGIRYYYKFLDSTCVVKFDINIGDIVSMLSKDREYYEYKEISLKHNDLHYVRDVEYEIPGPSTFSGYSYFDVDPVKIEIVSNKDFDDEHPAGTSLGDLFYFQSITPHPFIKNGYSGEEFTLINKRLNELTAEDMILSIPDQLIEWRSQRERDRIPQHIKDTMNYKGCDIMTAQIALLRSDFPTKEKVHTFTITITDDYGNKFTNTCTVDFNEAG